MIQSCLICMKPQPVSALCWWTWVSLPASAVMSKARHNLANRGSCFCRADSWHSSSGRRSLRSTPDVQYIGSTGPTQHPTQHPQTMCELWVRTVLTLPVNPTPSTLALGQPLPMLTLSLIMRLVLKEVMVFNCQPSRGPEAWTPCEMRAPERGPAVQAVQAEVPPKLSQIINPDNHPLNRAAWVNLGKTRKQSSNGLTHKAVELVCHRGWAFIRQQDN